MLGLEKAWNPSEARPLGATAFSRLVVATREHAMKNAHMSVASAATRLVLWLKLAVAWVAFDFLRLWERLLPQKVLSLLLWPPAAAWDLIHFHRRKLLTCWRRFPKSWHPRPLFFFLRQSLGLYHAQLVYAWPDRLSSPRWHGRCRFEGQVELVKSWDAHHPMILASVHVGPSEIMNYWLRAHGIVITTVRGAWAESLDRLARHQHALSPPADVPVFLPVKEMPRVRQFLRPGQRLLVMVDVDRGKQIHVPFENNSFRMATGAIRLAILTGAELIPCVIVETGTWKFAIHFGTPVPRSYLDNSPDMTAIGTHLLSEFVKVIVRYPEQCKPRFLSAISPAPKDEVSDLRALHYAAERH